MTFPIFQLLLIFTNLNTIQCTIKYIIQAHCQGITGGEKLIQIKGKQKNEGRKEKLV